MRMRQLVFQLSLVLGLAITKSYASLGDKSPYYQTCLRKCATANCTEDGDKFRPSLVQPFYLRITKWTCQDECRYDCMWKTVAAFTNRNWNIPQFHGKWPFVRIFGIQEPASFIFSIFNFVAHFMMIRQFRNEVRKTSPMYWLWHVYALICLNCWVWSTIFHARDTPFTEMMDYFSAFSTVLFSFYAMVIRLLNGQSQFLAVFISLLCISFFVHHVTYLAFVNFDYGYNMQANIAVGAANAMGWFIWCYYYREMQPYVWRCALFVLLISLCMLLEVLDFPPILWLIDAHSLWHLATAGLPFIFYRFLIDDCKHLRNAKELKRVHRD